MVDELMSKIKITGTERDDIYTITYNNPNPKLGKDVVQSLLTIFVEGSFGGKKQDSEKAVQFIDDQIKTYEEKLAAAENALKDFKIKNMGLLPREGGDYSAQMAGTTDQLSQARLELAEAEQARNAIARQISGDSGGASRGGAGAGRNPGTRRPHRNAEQEPRRAAHAIHRSSIRTSSRAKRLLAQLEAKKVEEATQHAPRADPGANYSPMLQQLKVALAEPKKRASPRCARASTNTARAQRAPAVARARRRRKSKPSWRS